MTAHIDKNFDEDSANSDKDAPNANVLVVEDDPVMQKRIKKILGMLNYERQQIYYASTLADAMDYIEQKPKLTLSLVDLGLPDGSGIDFIQALSNYDAEVCILVISAWSNDTAILSALKNGAMGYVLKERDDMEVSISIRNVLRGGAPIDPFIARSILQQLSSNTDTTDARVSANTRVTQNENSTHHTHMIKDTEQVLSKREYETLQLVGNGLSNREIADELNLSIFTVQTHIKSIYRKLAVSSRTKAINTAKSLGFL